LKKAAIAGAGSYHLIQNLNQIEEKVVLALQNNYTPTRIVTKLEAFDKDQNLIQVLADSFEGKKIDIILTSGTEFNFVLLTK
jgi:hypothetical protein